MVFIAMERYLVLSVMISYSLNLQRPFAHCSERQIYVHPYEGAKNYFYIADVDDHDYLSELVIETCKSLPEPKSRRKKYFHEQSIG